MNFTREPIIETIISPREGFKLLVRNSKGGGLEEYSVDALEVVSFGHAFFFRSLEGPKAFLVPASDYELAEVKETRVALKTVSHERNIKIGGGREASIRGGARAPVVEKEIEPAASDEDLSSESTTEETADSRLDNKRRDRRRHRRRRPSDEEWGDRSKPQDQQSRENEPTRADGATEGGGAEDETKVSSSIFSHLFPPPTTLISENLGRYKGKEFFEGNSLSKVKEEKKAEEETPPAPSPEDSEGSSPLHRIVPENVSASSFTATNFSPLQGPSGFDSFF